MTYFAVPVQNAAVQAVISAGADISVHDGDPSSGSATELSTPSARPTTTWTTPPVNGESAGSQVLFTGLQENDNATHFGVWGSGSLQFAGELEPAAVISETGELKVTPVVKFPAA